MDKSFLEPPKWKYKEIKDEKKKEKKAEKEKAEKVKKEKKKEKNDKKAKKWGFEKGWSGVYEQWEQCGF